MNIGDKISFPTGEGTIVVADQDTNGVIIVQDESGEYRRVAADAVKPQLDEVERLVLEALDYLPMKNSTPLSMEETVRVLIEVGYRKHASLNREFSTGDTYKKEKQEGWTAGIHIPGHGNAIEVYAGTQEGAKLLRDEILERLSC